MPFVRVSALVAAIVVLGASARPGAHHGSGADGPIWDYNNPFEVCGVVTKAEFINPHPQVRVTATDGEGNAKVWTFAISSTASLVRRGITRLAFQDELFAAGTRVHVQAFPDRRDPSWATAHTISLSDGRTLTDTSIQPPNTSTHVQAPRPRCST
jgi:hypothetical protein